MSDPRPPITLEEVTNPVDLAQVQRQREQFDRNFAWLQAHASEVYANHRGKCICIAGEELFVADTPEQALALGASAHPDDDGSFVHYIPLEKLTRIYAY